MIDSKLLWNSYTDGLDIDVAVVRGIATLTGAADTPASKDLAGRLADDTPGVITVRNLLTVDKSGRSTGMADAGDGTPTPGDGWIAARVDSTLRWSTGVDADAITVASSDGVVRLKGAVDSAYEKELAIELAQNTRGVERVDASALKVSEQDNRVSQN
jgi:osmotically-inducible protein OsmY